MIYQMRSILDIALISDIHIGAEPKLYYDIDVRKNFLLVLEKVLKTKPDLIVLCGDQALERGEREAYEWLREQLKEIEIPILQIMGNHDDALVSSEVFGYQDQLKDGELYYSTTFKGYPLIFLDSSSNRVGKKQLEWLKEEASKIDGEILLFMHHPPTISGSRFMDGNWPLLNLEEVQEVLKEIPNIRHIFSGHYHTTKTVQWMGKEIHLCPATQMQICEELEEFQVANLNPGWMSVQWNGKEIKCKTTFIDISNKQNEIILR